MRKFLIDTDTASDDAVALVMAAMHREIEIVAVTVVAGNVPLDKGVQNALYTLELCERTVPLYAGCAKPILRDLVTAQDVHGDDGMGDTGLPLTGRSPTPGHAVDVLIEKIHRHAGQITLVTLGPLTNVAVALLRDPSIARAVQQCVVMGGLGSGHGNTTPVAEYNIWCDPEAAKIVFESGMRLKMVGWDMSWQYATFNPQDAAALRSIGTPLAHFCVDIQAQVLAYAASETKLEGFDLPDPITMAVALDPTMAESQQCYVEITTGDGLHRGQTVVDKLGMMGKTPNVEVVTKVDRAQFVQMLRRSLGADD